jgi:uncharacterized protein (TIGR02118 family)
MIKTLSFLKRRPDLSRDAFREHYESTHVPLALPLLEGLRRYVRYHVEEECYGELGFDVLTYFGYADQQATQAVFRKMAGPEGRPILADELEFMDKPANRFMTVSERRLAGSADEESEQALFVLVKWPASKTRFDASARMLREHLAKLGLGDGSREPEISFALLRDGFPVEGGGPDRTLPFDQVLQLCGARESAVRDWAQSLEDEGDRVAVVRTKRFETDLG